MYQGEEARLRGGGLAAARERKHLALCINNQVRGAHMGGLCHHSFLCLFFGSIADARVASSLWVMEHFFFFFLAMM